MQPVVLWANGKACYGSITKHASVGSDYFKTITPIPGHSIVYVLAVSAWESYGENKNGDGFPEFPYKETANPPWIAADDVLTQHYKSFEQFGYNYRHHQNKDPNKSVGKVMKAFWNPPMHRVELLIDLDNAKAPDLAERIAAGEFPPVSMGTRVSYDVCSACGNRSPTRAEYCEHLKFQMREVLPNGQKVAALNPKPKFFDLSWVFKPADVMAYMMKKVAEPSAYELSGAAAGEYLDRMDALKLASHKLAVLDKVIQGIPLDAKTDNVDPSELHNLLQIRPSILSESEHTTDFPDELLRELSHYPLGDTLSTISSSGMMLNTPEFTKIVIYKYSPKAVVSDDILDKSVILQRSIMELLGDCPQILDELNPEETLGLNSDKVDAKIAQILYPYFEKRSGIGDYLSRRILPEQYRNETPYTTMFTLTDPVTGVRYGTTRGAAIRAHDELAKRNLYKILGGTAILGGAYKVFGNALARQGLGKAKPLAALALGSLGLSHLPTMGKHYLTEQGIPIPALTEISPLRKAATFRKQSAIAMPLLGTLATMALLGHDYTSRLARGEPVEHPALPLSRRLLDRLERFTYEHPLVTTAAGTLALRHASGTRAGKFMAEKAWPKTREFGSKVYGGARKALHDFSEGMKMSSWLENELPKPFGTVMLPKVDIDKISEKIGEIILEG